MLRTMVLLFGMALLLVGTGCGGVVGDTGGADAGDDNDAIVPPPPDDGGDDTDNGGDGPADGDNGQEDDGDTGDADDDAGTDDDADLQPVEFPLTSRLLLDDDGFIDRRFAWTAGCGGGNISPQLSWSDPPGGTQSFLVVIFDQDAGDFIHWVVFDIAPTVLDISEGGPAPGGQTLNDYDQGQFGYGGPCPPPGEIHTYVFRVYALGVANVGLTAGQPVTLSEVEAAMGDNILGRGEFTAQYAGP